MNILFDINLRRRRSKKRRRAFPKWMRSSRLLKLVILIGIAIYKIVKMVITIFEMFKG